MRLEVARGKKGNVFCKNSEICGGRCALSVGAYCRRFLSTGRINTPKCLTVGEGSRCLLLLRVLVRVYVCCSRQFVRRSSGSGSWTPSRAFLAKNNLIITCCAMHKFVASSLATRKFTRKLGVQNNLWVFCCFNNGVKNTINRSFRTIPYVTASSKLNVFFLPRTCEAAKTDPNTSSKHTELHFFSFSCLTCFCSLKTNANFNIV